MPADLVLLVGILGNISDLDVQALIAAAAQFCSPHADVVWSRGRDTSDLNDDVRAWFAAAGFAEVHYAALDGGSRPALGLMRYTGEPVDVVPVNSCSPVGGDGQIGIASENAIVQVPLAESPRHHHIALLTTLDQLDHRRWYAAAAIENG